MHRGWPQLPRQKAAASTAAAPQGAGTATTDLTHYALNVTKRKIYTSSSMPNCSLTDKPEEKPNKKVWDPTTITFRLKFEIKDTMNPCQWQQQLHTSETSALRYICTNCDKKKDYYTSTSFAQLFIHWQTRKKDQIKKIWDPTLNHSSNHFYIKIRNKTHHESMSMITTIAYDPYL